MGNDGTNMLKYDEPLVSICCITYNHANYISDALNGFLMQETTFPFEIIVHDDASNDGTQDVIKRYEAKYPKIFKCIFQEENQFSKGVRGIAARFAFPHAKGKYLALCEGDDYWTDRFKLQKQVDFMESNPDYSICFHRVSFLYDNDWSLFRTNKSNLNQPISTSIVDICRSNYIYTTSCLIRNWRGGKLPDWIKSVLPFDWPYFVLISQMGRIMFLPETMAVYRIHSNGIWGGNSLTYKWSQEIEMLNKLNAYLNRDDCHFAISAAIEERENSIRYGENKYKIKMILKSLLNRLGIS
jgi:glycosyltransferase involved in cell wall biosynthesis